ncbi:MAG: SDR family NAD(P)-dependent oxidoreductase [Ferruginibacter sp.]
MNKTILITGATSGIGLACAKKFAAAKNNLILTGRRKDRLDEIKASLQNEFGIQVTSLCFDVQKKTAVDAAFKTLETTAIDILVNNAGLALGRDAFDEADMTDWETMMQTNVNGLLYVTRAALPFLKRSASPHIVNLGSIAGKEVYEFGNVYCASKFAVDALSRSMRIDLLKHGIKVTAIHPGAVETEFALVRFKGNQEKAGATYKGLVPLTPADIADTIHYCCSLPPHVCINELIITCLQQAGTYYFNKNE